MKNLTILIFFILFFKPLNSYSDEFTDAHKIECNQAEEIFEIRTIVLSNEEIPDGIFWLDKNPQEKERLFLEQGLVADGDIRSYTELGETRSYFKGDCNISNGLKYKLIFVSDASGHNANLIELWNGKKKVLDKICIGSRNANSIYVDLIEYKDEIYKIHLIQDDQEQSPTAEINYIIDSKTVLPVNQNSLNSGLNAELPWGRNIKLK